MDVMDRYYRAYRTLLDEIEKTSLYRGAFYELNKADRGTDVHTGVLYQRYVDMDWVEAIEGTLRYIDGAIRENRRFIEQTEEIVPIARSRKITTESVRHLAQHTNMIARVDGDSVTPESILNINREESFAIYENRFLHTLLFKLSDFINKRYKGLMEASEDSVCDLSFQRSFLLDAEQTELDIRYSSRTRERSAHSMLEDVSQLTELERVQRLRQIIMDFQSTPLMRQLDGCEPVRPPIMRTNLITKDPNFKKALELWLFIETYQKDGYEIFTKEFSGEMEQNVKNGLYTLTEMLRFVVRMTSDQQIERRLQEQYEEENRRRTEEEELERKKQEDAAKARLAAALDAERAIWRSNIQTITQDYQRRLEEEQQLHAAQRNELIADYGGRLDDLSAAHRAELIRMEAEQEQILAGLEAEHKTALEMLRIQTAAEQDAALQAQEDYWTGVMLEERRQSAEELSRQQAQQQQELQTLQAQKQQELQTLQAQKQQELQTLRAQKQQELQTLQTQQQQELQTLQAKQDKCITAVLKDQQKEKIRQDVRYENLRLNLEKETARRRIQSARSRKQLISLYGKFLRRGLAAPIEFEAGREDDDATEAMK